jgi:tRNA threonylcarbamoyladenosine biosynthesis protein TsaE
MINFLKNEIDIKLLASSFLPLTQFTNYLCTMDAIFGLSQLESVAAGLWKEGKKFTVWAFHAPMGSGKTTFIHGLCKILGVDDAVSSPTFGIINDYQSKDAGIIHHMDWYRLKDEAEALQAGVEELLLSGEYCLVEWPEQAQGLLPEKTLHIKIEMLNETTRRLFTFNPADEGDNE